MSNEEPETFEFRLLDLDYQRIGPKNDQHPLLRLFGRTTKGKYILVRINDFNPYFYTSATPTALDQLRNPLFQAWLTRTEQLSKRIYHGGKLVDVLKVEGKRPWDIPELRKLFEQHNYRTFETDLSYEKRFLLDTGIHGMGMVTVRGTVQQRRPVLIVDALVSNVRPLKEDQVDPWTPLVMSITVEAKHQVKTNDNFFNRILSIGVAWGRVMDEIETTVFILTDSSDTAERQLLQDFLTFIDQIQPDILVTFQGNIRDLPTLINRLTQLHFSTARLSVTRNEEVYYSTHSKTYRIKGRVIIDVFTKCRFVHPPSGRKDLESIASFLLGIPKETPPPNIEELWQKSLSNLTSNHVLQHYLQRRSRLIYQLYWELGVSEWMEIRRVAGVPPAAGIRTTGRLCGEFVIMRECVAHAVLIPSLPLPEEVKKRRIERRMYPHIGGLVSEPDGLLYQGVFITDFKAFYPSLMIAYNIGGETYRDHGKVKTPEDIFQFESPETLFVREPQSCLSRMLTKLLAARWTVKAQMKNLTNPEDQLARKILKRREQAFKIVVNAMYGAQNYIRGRFYSLCIGNAITTISWRILEKLNHWVINGPVPAKVVYGDTDSAFIQLRDPTPIDGVFLGPMGWYEKRKAKAIAIAEQLVEYVNTQLPTPIRLGIDDIAYRVAFSPGRKKSYAYVSILDPSFPLEIKGFEAVRSDWSPLARQAQIDFLNVLLREWEKPFEKGRDLILKQCVKVLQEPTEQLKPNVTILTSITRPPHTYMAFTPAIGAFFHYCKINGLDPNKVWKKYDRFHYIIIPGKKLLAFRACHPQYVTQIDRWYYVTEILRVVSRFGIELTMSDVKQYEGQGLSKYIL